jgi:quercetin dioxygenase-like cupin family protein
VTDNRREFLAAGLTLLAATLSERLAAESGAPRVDGLQQPATNPSRPVATKDAPAVNLEGWQMTATEVTIPPGAPPGRKHRHPGFVIGYVLEGQYSFAVNDQAPRVVSAGQMFFESFDAPGEVHSGSSNASTTQPVKFLAIVFHKKGDPVTIPG